jgi:hypothetical protein
MSRMTITTGPKQNNSRPANATTNHFSIGGGGKGNLFANANHRTPITEAQKDTIHVCITVFPIQPNTTARLNNYRDQCCAWLTTFGANQKITKLTGFLVHPGGVLPGSGECYVCGKGGHTWPNCTNEQVPFKERQWWSVCSTILGHGRLAPAPINLVQAAEDFRWMNSAGFKDNVNQGNREGPST